jgi:predicted nucleic acid-binding protein
MPKKHEELMSWKNMVNKVLLDTNIIVDLFDKTRPYSQDSLKSVQMLLERGALLYVNSDTLTTTFYLLRSQKKATFLEAIEAIKETSELCELISIEITDVENTVLLCKDTKTPFKDYEDAMQYICAKKVDTDLILTNDKGFISPDIKVKNSTELYE